MTAGTRGGGVAGENHLGFATSEASARDVTVGTISIGVVSSTCTADGNGARGSTTIVGTSGLPGNPEPNTPASITIPCTPSELVNLLLKERIVNNTRVPAERFAVVQFPPSVAVTKTANPLTRPEPGGTFTYTVVVTNTSMVEPLTINSDPPRPPVRPLSGGDGARLAEPRPALRPQPRPTRPGTSGQASGTARPRAAGRRRAAHPEVTGRARGGRPDGGGGPLHRRPRRLRSPAGVGQAWRDPADQCSSNTGGVSTSWGRPMWSPGLAACRVAIRRAGRDD